jgi:hypothetical protein
MAAGKYNFTIEQGATTSFELQYLDSNNEPVDLNGYVARMQLKNEKQGNTTYLTLSTTLEADGTGINLRGSDGTNPLASGSIGVYISAAVTEALNFDTAFYDLELVTNGTPQEVTRLIEGIVVLSKEVTTIS